MNLTVIWTCSFNVITECWAGLGEHPNEIWHAAQHSSFLENSNQPRTSYVHAPPTAVNVMENIFLSHCRQAEANILLLYFYSFIFCFIYRLTHVSDFLPLHSISASSVRWGNRNIKCDKTPFKRNGHLYYHNRWKPRFDTRLLCSQVRDPISVTDMLNYVWNII